MTENTLHPIAIEALRRLHEAGYESYLVGGYVRDLLLGRTPHDIDITTNALPGQVHEVFVGHGRYDVGERHGTVGVLFGDTKVEITTYRTEQYDGVTRQPVVRFGTSLEEDLARRDFTINAMAMTIGGQLVDLFKGERDLRKGVLHAVGRARDRFHEDPLRLMRAVRLATQLQLAITPMTTLGIHRSATELSRISRERIQEELTKILLSQEPGRGIAMLESLELLPYVIPELQEQIGIHQSYPHHKDVFGHTMLVVDGVPVELRLRLAALLHDIAKPRTKSVEGGVVHFYNHEHLGAEMAGDVLRRLRYPGELVDGVSRLVGLHMRPNMYREDYSNAAVRRLVRDAGHLLPDLLVLSKADITSQRAQRVREAIFRLDHLRRRTEQADIAGAATVQSPLTGEEIMQLLGIGPGPEVGRIKRALTDAAIDGSLAVGDSAGAAALAHRIHEGDNPEEEAV